MIFTNEGSLWRIATQPRVAVTNYSMNHRSFGTLPNGKGVTAHLLVNSGGASAEILSYGGIIRELCMPDRTGQMADVVLGFEHLEQYLESRAYFGAIIGRIAGRVTGGRLNLLDGAYSLACNDGPNHLHGGYHGFDRRIWSIQPIPGPEGGASLRLDYRSPDGEEGYPGAVDVGVTYTLTKENRLILASEATAENVTALCLTYHSYFNLAGETSLGALDHMVQIFAEDFEPCDDVQMTHSGRRISVNGHPTDFRKLRRLGDSLPALWQGHGDFYFLPKPSGGVSDQLVRAARVIEPTSGRVLEVLTNESCLQFYTGAFIGNQPLGKYGRPYGPYAGICLECQGHPDGAGRTDLGDILIQPGAKISRTTIYAFSTE